MKKLVSNISLLLLVLLGSISCNIKEDMSNCPGSIILDYSAYPEEVLNEIGAEEQIDIFIFDAEGICVEDYRFTYEELKKQGLEFKVPIKYRNYQAVVWHGLDSKRYASSSMAVGANIVDFYMRLVSDAATNSYSRVPDPLWASPLEPIEFCAKITRHRIHMTRLHTKVELIVKNKRDDGTIEELDMKDYVATIEAENNVYHTDYSIDLGESIELDYNNKAELETEQELDCACVGTLRITPDMPCMLSIAPKGDTNTHIAIDGKPGINLAKYMLDFKDDDSISDQRFLDLNKIWKMELLVKEHAHRYVAISLTINGWVVWFTNTGLN